MSWWWWLIIGFAVLIIFILLRMDWAELAGEEDFMGKLRALKDACCLGDIFKKH